MGVAGQEFAVAEVMRVEAGMAFRDFPPFPVGGTLLMLKPPFKVGERELSSHAAELQLAGRPMRVDYRYWHLNAHDVIGLLCDSAAVSTVALGTRLKFVRRK